MKIFNLKAQRWSGPLLPQLDEAGRRLYFRSCDIAARFWLNDMGMPADRLAYELAPWPKGMMKVEPDDAYALPRAAIPSTAKESEQ